MDVKGQNRHNIYGTALTLDRGTLRLMKCCYRASPYIRDHPETAKSTLGCALTIMVLLGSNDAMASGRGRACSAPQAAARTAHRA